MKNSTTRFTCRKEFNSLNLTVLFCLLSFSLFSCASTSSLEEDSRLNGIHALSQEEQWMTTVEDDVVKYKDGGIRCQVEDMLLTDMETFEDNTAGNGKGALLKSKSSSAAVKVALPAGTYECMVCVKSFSSENYKFHIIIDDIPYLLYPSNPPLGCWEMTVRVPVVFTVVENKIVNVTIQSDSSKEKGDVGMSLDFVQFVKLPEESAEVSLEQVTESSPETKPIAK